MASARNQMIRNVKGGERHIYPVFENNSTDTKTQDEHHMATKSAFRAHAFQPTILVNVENKNVGAFSKVKHTEKKSTSSQKKHVPQESKYKKRTGSAKHKKNPEPRLPYSVTSTYGVPAIHSTLHVTEALIRAREEEPDLNLLVKNKLDSPNTGSRLKKQVSKKANVPGSKPVFRELVSVDVSEGELATQLKDQLNIRAAAVKPLTRLPDPVPTLSDILDPEEFVSSASIITAPTYLPFSSVTPRTFHHNELATVRDYILDLNYSSVQQDE